jgi:hypothetical protein
MKLQLDEKSTGSTPLDELIEFLTRVKGLESTHRDDAPPAYPGHSGKSSVDIIGDYLSKVRETTYKEMTKSYGEKLLGSMSKELVITVPAVWSERAKDLTYKAVSRAGFGANKIMMVTEPEAAAVYTLKGMAEGVSKADIKVSPWPPHHPSEKPLMLTFGKGRRRVCPL